MVRHVPAERGEKHRAGPGIVWLENPGGTDSNRPTPPQSKDPAAWNQRVDSHDPRLPLTLKFHTTRERVRQIAEPLSKVRVAPGRLWLTYCPALSRLPDLWNDLYLQVRTQSLAQTGTVSGTVAGNSGPRSDSSSMSASPLSKLLPPSEGCYFAIVHVVLTDEISYQLGGHGH